MKIKVTVYLIGNKVILRLEVIDYTHCIFKQDKCFEGLLYS